MSRVCGKCKVEKPDSDFSGKKTCKGCSKKYCEHNKIKAQCLPCGGSSMCEHGIRKSTCIQCAGISRCSHGKLKYQCEDCGGSRICEHKIQKALCKICLGTAICEHNKQKAACKLCKGSSICEHDNIRFQCVKCSPQNACVECKYVHVPKKYRFHPYCFSCFCYLHPDVEIPRKFKIKENHVRDFLKDEFKESITMVFDRKVEYGCSARRPDVRIDFGSHTVIVECDENQHKGYSCENKRTMEIFQDCGNRPIVFLRFNPDSYEMDGKKYESCFSPTKLGLKVDDAEFRRRMREVVAYIEKYRLDIPTKEVNVHQFFYDQG